MLLFLPEGLNAQQKHSFTRQKMGSPFTVIVYHDDQCYVDSVVGVMYREVDRLNAVFSDYMDSSELNELSATAGSKSFHPVSPELFDILNISKKAAARSEGAFDVTVGPLSKIWRNARKLNQLPSKNELRSRLKSIGYKNLVLDEKKRKVKLRKKKMQLDLGGIAKGYIAQKAMDKLFEAGLHRALVDAGGDMVLGENPPGRDGWKIGIATLDSANELMPRHLVLSEHAVATSGDSFQHLDYGGKRYSHIIDPKTGNGVTYHRNVTAIAGDGSTADWVASACSVMKLKDIKRFLKKMPQVSVMITEKVDGRLIQLFYNGFEKYLE